MLVVALGIAVGSAKLFGVSMALGAFLAGMVVGRSEFSLRAATDALPMRDAFAVLFFVSVGMLFDPRYLLDAPWLVAATLGIVVLGKPLAALAIVLALGYPLRVALAVAVALAQIGEFSFILAALGRGLGVLPEAATNALVGGGHRVDLGQPAALPPGRSGRGVARPPPTPVAVAGPPGGLAGPGRVWPGRRACRPIPGGRGGVRAGRADACRGCSARTTSSRPSSR